MSASSAAGLADVADLVDEIRSPSQLDDVAADNAVLVVLEPGATGAYGNLNRIRPSLAMRSIRLVCWCIAEAVDELAREAPDLYDWATLVLEVPPLPTRLAEATLQDIGARGISLGLRHDLGPSGLSALEAVGATELPCDPGLEQIPAQGWLYVREPLDLVGLRRLCWTLARAGRAGLCAACTREPWPEWEGGTLDPGSVAEAVVRLGLKEAISQEAPPSPSPDARQPTMEDALAYRAQDLLRDGDPAGAAAIVRELGDLAYASRLDGRLDVDWPVPEVPFEQLAHRLDELEQKHGTVFHAEWVVTKARYAQGCRERRSRVQARQEARAALQVGLRVGPELTALDEIWDLTEDRPPSWTRWGARRAVEAADRAARRYAEGEAALLLQRGIDAAPTDALRQQARAALAALEPESSGSWAEDMLQRTWRRVQETPRDSSVIEAPRAKTLAVVRRLLHTTARLAGLDTRPFEGPPLTDFDPRDPVWHALETWFIRADLFVEADPAASTEPHSLARYKAQRALAGCRVLHPPQGLDSFANYRDGERQAQPTPTQSALVAAQQGDVARLFQLLRRGDFQRLRVTLPLQSIIHALLDHDLENVARGIVDRIGPRSTVAGVLDDACSGLLLRTLDATEFERATDQALHHRSLRPVDQQALHRWVALYAVRSGMHQPLRVLDRVLDSLPKTSDSFNTNTHYCFSVLQLVDSVAAAVLEYRTGTRMDPVQYELPTT